MSTQELVAKFCHNAEGVLSPSAIDSVVTAVLDLDKAENFAAIMKQVARTRQ